MGGLRRTPLYERHRALGARLVEFAGWEMPVQYGSILAEHRAVREQAGLFDVSHMGQLHLRGPGAEASVARLVTCPVATLRVGQVRYGLLCHETGGVVDDVTVHRTAPDAFFLCVNAANVEKDRSHVERHAGADADVRDRSDETGLLALQGPASAAILARVTEPDPGALRRFRFAEARVAGRPALVARTGYTGSDGFELYCAAADAGALWDALLEAGRAFGLVPVGLGARDTLRLEAALPLYGHELDDATTPLEAGLERFVDLDRGQFLGADALRAQRVSGVGRRLVGFELVGRGVARGGYALLHGSAEVGRVTSGAPSPTLGKSIGLGYVPPALAPVGTELAVRIRDQAVPARVVPTPFVGRR
jgi:aminomethyltransferase